MKIGFATDTNILKKKNLSDYKKILDVTDIYTEYIDALNKIKSEHELIYYMPEIVVDELLMQKEFSFNQTYKSFQEKYIENSYGLLGELPKNNIKEILVREKEEYIGKYKLIKLEYTADLLEKLVKEALIKRAPFDKTIEGKKTDAGFKDALIWKTIVMSKEIDSCDEFYFFTSDRVFDEGKEELLSEFQEQHSKTSINIIYIENDGSHRQSVLNFIIDKHGLYKTDVIELYDNNLVKNYFNKITFKPTDITYYYGNGVNAELTKVLFQNFENSDFFIDKVEKESDKFNIYCSFRTLKYELDIDVDLENRKYIIGNIKITVKEKKDKYAYVCSEVSKVDFDLGVIDILRGFSIGLGNVAKEMSKIVSENIANMESFNALKELQKALQNQERNEILQSINSPLKDLKIPTVTEILKNEK